MIADARTTERRIEAIVDGNTALEGFAHTDERGVPAQLWIRPTYLRAGLLTLDAAGIIEVRPRAERDAALESSIDTASETVRIDSKQFCEVWLDGRLSYMSR